jgi:hypothetical protein
MFDKPNLWDTSTVLGVMRETTAISSYWLDHVFPGVVTSEDEYIDFEKIPNKGRKLAPFVLPLAQGKPVYEQGSKVYRFKPAYIKPSDPVTPTRVLSKQPGAIFAPTQPSAAQRYNAIKADITAFHRQVIERRWEWLGARAVIDGKVTIEGEGYPPVLVDFGRDAAHDIVLVGTARWGQANGDIKGNLSSWSNLMHRAAFGGRPTRLTVGVDVWAVMERDEGLMKLMNTQFRGSTTELVRDQIGTGEVTYVGRLGSLEVYVYNDYYTEGGVLKPFMQQDEIVLTGPNIMGYRCFGAIQDVNANFQALPIFSRNYVTTGDVAIEQIVSQSAPLMVPMNPNASLRAKVL